jgi:HEPN domain-containing protein
LQDTFDLVWEVPEHKDNEVSDAEVLEELLRKAGKDIDIARFLIQRRDLRDYSLYHIQQAIEKTLKVFLIDFYVNPISDILNIIEKCSVRTDKHRRAHQILKKFQDLKGPEKLGHEVLTEKATEILKELAEGLDEILEYILYVYIECLNKYKDKADQLYIDMITLIRSFVEGVKEVRRSNIELHLDSVRGIKKLRPKPCYPCLRKAIEQYNKIKNLYEQSLNRSIKELDLYMKMHNAEKELNNIQPSILREVSREVLEYVKFFIDIVIKDVFKEFVASLEVYPCLLNYENVGTRYPSKSCLRVPDEDLDAVSEILVIAENLYNSVKRYFTIARQISATQERGEPS